MNIDEIVEQLAKMAYQDEYSFSAKYDLPSSTFKSNAKALLEQYLPKFKVGDKITKDGEDRPLIISNIYEMGYQVDAFCCSFYIGQNQALTEYRLSEKPEEL